MNKGIHFINKIINIGLIVFMIYKIIVDIANMSFSKILTVLSIIPILLVPFIVKKLFHYQMSEVFKLIYYLFVIVALVLGSILGWYYQISWLDLLAHFLSGVLASFCSLILLKEKKLLKENNIGFIILYMISFTLMIASFWEFFEFFSDKLLGGDAQWVVKTGVDDTMTDMLVAFLGSIGFSIYFLIQMNVNEKNFMKFLNKVL